MSESFEARLTSASSKEIFKKGKKLLKNGCLLCCMENEAGGLRAVFREPDGTIRRCEFRGFPKGPFSAVCDCGSDAPGFCGHAMAAALYHAKYTVKYKDPDAVQDTPAQYASLKFSGLPALLTQALVPQTAFVEVHAQNEFPHVPSKWDKITLTVTLRTDRREYFGNMNNLRQLHFGKSLAASLYLDSFPLQDRQIIRFLAISGQADGADITLDSELCAEFFHSLCGFRRFYSMGENVVIHREPAAPLLLLEKVREGFLLRSAIAVDSVPLPLQDVKVIAGRTGCWLGMLGEYWWIPGSMDLAWLRSFLRTTVQPCDAQAAQVLLDAGDTLPVRIIASSGSRLRQKNFKTLYDGSITPEGFLELQVFFDYEGLLCKADHHRLLSGANGKFLRRNSEEEQNIIQELVNFGFRQTDGTRRKDGAPRFILKDREAIGMFTDELIPKWLREKRPCLLSSVLASLTGNTGSLTLKCRVLESDAASYSMEFSLAAAGIPIRWKRLLEAAEKNEFFMSASPESGLVKLPLPLQKLARAFGEITEILPQRDELPDSDILRIPRSSAFLWASLLASFSDAVPVEFLRIKVDMESLRQEIRQGITAVPPELFHGELRKYQAAGVYWLNAMFRRNCNVILADEMGLGKTVQSLALLLKEPELTLPAMVVCPTSLTDNWKRESLSFTPSLRVCVIEGSSRAKLWEKVPDCDLCICSYALLKRDLTKARNQAFRTLILDEAQHIKNPASANARSCKQIRADHKLVLTGTPMENSADDLWSIFDFLQPGFLGPLPKFRSKYGKPDSNPALREELSERIAPFILRRKKSEVCTELPPKQEQILSCEMSAGQRTLYQKFSRLAEKSCLAWKEGRTTGAELLAGIMRLRQICCDPALLPEQSAAAESAKTELLKELLQETMGSGHKTLVFSQFTSYLAIIRSWLDEKKIPYEYLDGSTKQRMKRVDSFNKNPEIPVFLLSLKAGGTGLNLTSADTVIICDPWWNPAAEDQAADRTHRIGQTKSVNCIKLAVKDSIEERVLLLQKKKRELFNALVEESGAGLGALTLEDFEFLLAGDQK